MFTRFQGVYFLNSQALFFECFFGKANKPKTATSGQWFNCQVATETRGRSLLSLTFTPITCHGRAKAGCAEILAMSEPETFPVKAHLCAAVWQVAVCIGEAEQGQRIGTLPVKAHLDVKPCRKLCFRSASSWSVIPGSVRLYRETSRYAPCKSSPLHGFQFRSLFSLTIADLLSTH